MYSIEITKLLRFAKYIKMKVTMKTGVKIFDSSVIEMSKCRLPNKIYLYVNRF